MAIRPQSIGSLIAELDAHKRQQYRQLLSGTSRHRTAARKDISRFLAAFNAMYAHPVLDDIKKWLANEDGTKTLEYLDSINERAKKLTPGKDDWETKWVMARAFRVAGRYMKAYNHYKKALLILNDTPAVDLTPDMTDVYVDYAEFLVYVGGPATALENITYTELPDIGGGPNSLRKVWHLWAKGFALHQLAYSEMVPTGSEPSANPGDPRRYLASNVCLDEALNWTESNPISAKSDPLSDSEKCDVWLLKAANFGGLMRCGVPDAESAATDALDNFVNGEGADLTNRVWSCEKEARGRFMKVYRKKMDKALFQKGDAANDRLPMVNWRKAYEFHFFENLRAAGVDQFSSSDGEVGTDANFPDDDPS